MDCRGLRSQHHRCRLAWRTSRPARKTLVTKSSVQTPAPHIIRGAHRMLTQEQRRSASGRLLDVDSPRGAQQVAGFLGDSFENGRIERFCSNGQAFEHGTEELLQHQLARSSIERAEFRPDGGQTLSVFSDVIEADELDIDELENGQAWVGVAPPPAQVRPKSMGENLLESTLGVLADHGPRLGIQHPVDARISVSGSEPERPHDPQAEFVLGQTVVAGVQNGSQDCTTQKADEKKIVEVPRLKGGVLAIVSKPEELALLLWNATVGPVHPFEGGCDEECRG